MLGRKILQEAQLTAHYKLCGVKKLGKQELGY